MHSNYLLIDFLNKKLVNLKKKQIAEYKQKAEMIIDDHLKVSKAQLYTYDYFISDKQEQNLEAAYSLFLEDTPVQHKIG